MEALLLGSVVRPHHLHSFTAADVMCRHTGTFHFACKTFFDKGEVRTLCVATSIWISTKVVISKVHVFVLVRCWKRPLLAISARYGHTALEGQQLFKSCSKFKALFSFGVRCKLHERLTPSGNEHLGAVNKLQNNGRVDAR